MGMDARRMAREGGRNLLLVAVLFLPLFLLGAVAETSLRVGAAAFQESLGYHASGAAVIYLSMLLPALLGSVVHSGALALMPHELSRTQKRVAAVFLAPLVPLVFILHSIGGWPLLWSFPISTAIGTLAYGFACSTDFRRGPTAA